MKGTNGQWGMVLNYDGTFSNRWIEWDANGMPFVMVGGYRCTIVAGESVDWLLI